MMLSLLSPSNSAFVGSKAARTNSFSFVRGPRHTGQGRSSALYSATSLPSSWRAPLTTLSAVRQFVNSELQGNEHTYAFATEGMPAWSDDRLGICVEANGAFIVFTFQDGVRGLHPDSEF